MAARLPRRSFATPFVVTFAAACSTNSPPPAVPQGNGPPPEPVATAPNSDPSTGPTTPEPVQPTPPETTDPQAPGPTPPIHRNPPPQEMPEPAETPVTAINWTVYQTDGKCHAMAPAHCPEAKPGQSPPTCNPPPARDYSCPSGVTKYPITIVQRGPGNCTLPPPQQACPPHMHCNPPPMRRVPCPGE